jgi:5-methyltetrahydrofolate--homocysteine methyltransferase
VAEVLVADGGMGTELLRAGLTARDYQGREGCHDFLSVTRPDVVESVHRAYLAVGCQALETNSFGAHPLVLEDYGLADRAGQIAAAAARAARRAVDQAATSGSGHRALVLGSMGPGSKLPSLGHAAFAELRRGYAVQAAGLLEGGADRILVETCQDLLQAKAAVLGARDADSAAHVTVHFTVETTGTMLLGTETPAAAASLLCLGVDGIGLNCATGPAEMSEHLRVLAELADVPVSVMPNAGLPTIGPDGEARYALSPEELADWLERFVRDYGLAMVGGCCGTTPAHLAAVVARLGAHGFAAVPDAVRPGGGTGSARVGGRTGGLLALGGLADGIGGGTDGIGGLAGGAGTGSAGTVASLYQAVPLSQELTYLAVGERTNANGSKAFREAMLAGDLDACVQIARGQAAAGAHVLDVSVDYVGRDGVADMAAVAGALATASTLPVMIDSTDPAVIRTALEHLGGRSLVNSVNFEDPERFEAITALVVEHGAAVVALTIDEGGQARTAAEKVAVARRLIGELTGRGVALADIVVDPLTFPIGTGQEETRRDALETLGALSALRAEFPPVHLMLGVSNVSFGLAPAARVALNSVFLDQAVKAGLDAAIIRPGGILPLDRLDAEVVHLAEDLVFDRRRPGYDPLMALIEATAGATAASADRPALADLPVLERLAERLISGNRAGLNEDLDAALAEGSTPLEIINDELLPAMETVGELFGAGRMQLPFVLQSAEVMKAAVAHLEPHMAAETVEPKGTVVLATVAGDVHDIGKNLVDIVLSNNGYNVRNLGIKQSIGQMLAAAEESGADAIGMSGLLVKSTQVMRQNLAEMTVRGVADRWPVILGGAALTRRFVENDLAGEFPGRVMYAKDAFEGLRLLNGLLAPSGQPTGEAEGDRGGSGAPPAEDRPAGGAAGQTGDQPGRSAPGADARPGSGPTGASGSPPVAGKGVSGRRDSAPVPGPGPGTTASAGVGVSRRRGPVPGPGASASAAGDGGERLERAAIPVPPFWGARRAKGIPLGDYLPHLDKRALFEARWGLKAGLSGLTVGELAATQGEPRLAALVSQTRRDGLAVPQVAWGYFPVRRDGDSVVVLSEPRPDAEERARFAFPRQDGGRRRCLADYVDPEAVDVLALQVVTIGPKMTEATAKLFAGDDYRAYLELHGFSVELAEALAEATQRRIARELGLEPGRGRRYSFGYPACPDLGQRRILFDLLDAGRIGLRLTDGDLLEPEQSTDALVFHHPQATYFNVRKTR